MKPEAGRNEATGTTLWFGIKDGIVIRVRPLEAVVVVDVCSLLRIGGSNIGTHARRAGFREAAGRRMIASIAGLGRSLASLLRPSRKRRDCFAAVGRGRTMD